MENLKQNELFARLIEYRIDFAYTRQAYFNAYDRVNRHNKWIDFRNKLLGLFSILISIFTLSALTIYLMRDAKEIGIINIVSCLSIISLIISIYLYSTNKPQDSSHYLERAEAYSILFKKVKNFEAFCKTDPEISSEKIWAKLLYFENEQEKLLKRPLEIKKVDFDLAKENIISKKNYEYNDEDREYT